MEEEHSKLLVGTTDTPIQEHSLEPRALDEEVNFILDTASKYFKRKIDKKDVLSVFAGLRPLAAPSKNDSITTKEISRGHKLMIANSGLITITGGKWTTYRKMSEETVDTAIQTSILESRKCITKDLKIHASTSLQLSGHLAIYGTDMDKILKLTFEIPNGVDQLHPLYPNIKAEVIWAVRNEMAYTVEDVLSRRMRMLFIDAKAAIEMCPSVAQLMAQEMQKSPDWIEQQILEFMQIASEYLLEPFHKEEEAILT